MGLGDKGGGLWDTFKGVGKKQRFESDPKKEKKAKIVGETETRGVEGGFSGGRT